MTHEDKITYTDRPLTQTEQKRRARYTDAVRWMFDHLENTDCIEAGCGCQETKQGLIFHDHLVREYCRQHGLVAEDFENDFAWNAAFQVTTELNKRRSLGG